MKHAHKLLLLLGLWVLLQLVVLRHHFLDDAFIHLRYAHHLVDLQRISYNGQTPDFGTSSLLYTLILALGTLLTRDAYLPKIVSVLAYLCVWLLGARVLLRPRAQGQQVLAGALLVVLSSPFALRWLTDGMETSCVALMALLLAIWQQNPQPTRPRVLLACLLPFLAVLLRVEFLFVLSLAFAGHLLEAWLSPDRAQRLRNLAKIWLPALLSSLLAILLILHLFGHLLPDTAIAKRPPPEVKIQPLATTIQFAIVHAASSLFGVGLGLMWLFSLVMARKTRHRREQIPLLAVNLGWLVFLLLLIVTRQAIQGVRYFVFLYSFLIAFNLLQVRATLLLSRKWQLAVVPLLAWLSFDAFVVQRLSRGRSQTWVTFSSAQLSPLSGLKGLAYDIGFAGYFTNGDIQDVNGLINGRQIAAMPTPERLRVHLQQNLAFAFVNDYQLRDVHKQFPAIAAWPSVLHADFPNADGLPDRHWLLVRPDVARQFAHTEMPEIALPK